MNMASGGLVDDPLNSTEEDLIQILTPVSVEGLPNIKESSACIAMSSTIEKDTEFIAENNEGEIASTNNIRSVSNFDTPSAQSCNTRTDKTNSISIQSQSRNIAKRGGIKLRRAESAVQSWQELMKKKIEIKELYYQRKLKLLEEKNNILKENGCGVQ